MLRLAIVLLILAATPSTRAAGSAGDFSDQPVTEREAKVLALVDRSPRNSTQIISELQQLHGDVDIAFLVRRYGNDETIEESFRSTLLQSLYREVRESGRMEEGTAAIVTEFGRAENGYFGIATAARLLEASGRSVPWSIRIRQKEFQWGVLGWVGLLSLATGSIGGLYLLVLLALPGERSALSGAQRAVGLLLWLILTTAFLAAAGMALIQSHGHSAKPPPGQAVPYYAAGFVIAVLYVIASVLMHRRRSSPSRQTGLPAAPQ